jgi:predicted RNA-binding Zn-ribbon protein involved in translation (DUF1610 family)
MSNYDQIGQPPTYTQPAAQQGQAYGNTQPGVYQTEKPYDYTQAQTPQAVPMTSPQPVQGIQPVQSPQPMQMQPQYMQPQQQQQQQQQQSKYLSAVPLAGLTIGSAPVDCPSCGKREVTRTTAKTGQETHIWALVTCLLTCCGCLIYLFDFTKDVEHRCGNCGVLLATWQRRGGTQVHIHS